MCMNCGEETLGDVFHDRNQENDCRWYLNLKMHFTGEISGSIPESLFFFFSKSVELFCRIQDESRHYTEGTVVWIFSFQTRFPSVLSLGVFTCNSSSNLQFWPSCITPREHPGVFQLETIKNVLFALIIHSGTQWNGFPTSHILMSDLSFTCK